MSRPTESLGNRADLKMTLALGGAVVAAVVIAVATTRGAAISSEQLAASAKLAASAEEPPATRDANLTGRVLETLPVSQYTYLRLSTSSGEIWAAVPSASIAVGSQVAIENATRMVDFKSKTLKRTFPVIYFGNLAKPSAGAAPEFAPADVPPLDDNEALPPGHPDIGAGAMPTGTVADGDSLPPGHPDIGAQQEAAADGTASEPALLTVQIEPARGRNAHVISELTAERQKLAGQRVRVRGQVTKVTPDVQGHAFFHLRDASGKQSDLVVTSMIAPERGQVATFEGILRMDVDVGIGYKYAVLLQEATRLAD